MVAEEVAAGAPAIPRFPQGGGLRPDTVNFLGFGISRFRIFR